MNQLNDYTELDAAIVEQIKAGFASFSRLSTLSEKVLPFLENSRSPFGTSQPWRVIDRRLQALRKNGIIWYSPADRRWYCGPAP